MKKLHTKINRQGNRILMTRKESRIKKGQDDRLADLLFPEKTIKLTRQKKGLLIK